MMDYLTSKATGKDLTFLDDTSTTSEVIGINKVQGMKQEDYNKVLTDFFSGGQQSTEKCTKFYNKYGSKISFTQFKMLVALIDSSDDKNTIIQKYYFDHYTFMVSEDTNELLDLLKKNQYYQNSYNSVRADITRHWSTLQKGKVY